MKDKDALLKRFDIGVQGGIGFEMIFNLLITHNIYLCKFHVICGEYEFWHTPFLFTLLCDTEKHYPIGGILTVGYRF